METKCEQLLSIENVKHCLGPQVYTEHKTNTSKKEIMGFLK